MTQNRIHSSRADPGIIHDYAVANLGIRSDLCESPTDVERKDDGIGTYIAVLADGDRTYQIRSGTYNAALSDFYGTFDPDALFYLAGDFWIS